MKKAWEVKVYASGRIIILKEEDEGCSLHMETERTGVVLRLTREQRDELIEALLGVDHG